MVEAISVLFNEKENIYVIFYMNQKDSYEIVKTTGIIFQFSQKFWL